MVGERLVVVRDGKLTSETEGLRSGDDVPVVRDTINAFSLVNGKG